jgi:hypothetical protein
MGLPEIDCESGEQIELSQNRAQGRSFMKR